MNSWDMDPNPEDMEFEDFIVPGQELNEMQIAIGHTMFLALKAELIPFTLDRVHQMFGYIGIEVA